MALDTPRPRDGMGGLVRMLSRPEWQMCEGSGGGENCGTFSNYGFPGAGSQGQLWGVWLGQEMRFCMEADHTSHSLGVWWQQPVSRRPPGNLYPTFSATTTGRALALLKEIFCRFKLLSRAVELPTESGPMGGIWMGWKVAVLTVRGEGTRLCGPFALTSVSIHLKAPWRSVHRPRYGDSACLGEVLCRQLAAVGSAGAWWRRRTYKHAEKHNTELLSSPFLWFSTFHLILLYRLEMLANKSLWDALLTPTSVGQSVNITQFLHVFDTHLCGAELCAWASVSAVEKSSVLWGEWTPEGSLRRV